MIETCALGERDGLEWHQVRVLKGTFVYVQIILYNLM